MTCLYFYNENGKQTGNMLTNNIFFLNFLCVDATHLVRHTAHSQNLKEDISPKSIDSQQITSFCDKYFFT